MNTNNKIIDIALKYGYDSPDSFTKAFSRFHGSTPTAVRNGAKIREFTPLKINLILKGGNTMEYKIEEKDAFKVVGLKDSFKYETAYQDVPKIHIIAKFGFQLRKNNKNHSIYSKKRICYHNTKYIDRICKIFRFI